jgi:hypothetical protein
MGSCGYCAAARDRRIYLIAFRLACPAIADSSSGARGHFKRVLEALAADLRARGELDLTECFIDATFVAAKKGS